MMGGFGGIMMIAFLIFVVWAVVWVVREIKGGNFTTNAKALDILKERYAKGEIDKKEFEEKKKDLI